MCAYQGFISDIEQYHQDSWHGTGHTIEENRMKLSKVGTGEGGQHRGWGVYSAQARDVAESYRRYGLPQYTAGRKKFSIKLKDGSVLRADYYLNSYRESDREIREIFIRINNLLRTGSKPDTKTLIESLRSYFSNALDTGLYSFTQDLLEDILHTVDNISDIQVSPELRGNIYRLDVPENDIILNWDAALRNQPKHVKQAIEKIRHFIHRFADEYELDTSAFDAAKTGGALYESIADIMYTYVRELDNAPADGIFN